MTSLFISYSRRDTDCARRLTESFKGQELDFWIDWEGIPPTVDWWKEIEKGIEEADVFLFILSPDSIKSKVCKQEIDYAIKNGKRLIPVVVRDVNPEESPAGLGHLNWIFIRESDDFNIAFDRLITAIKTDYEWVKVHRDLQVKALEWERSSHDKSFLLRGTELQDAEFQLATNSSKEPYPTDLQRDYILRSRQAADRQRRLVTTIGIAVGIALAALAVFGWIQAGLAKEAQATAEAASTEAIAQKETAQANEARARANELAALAKIQAGNHLSRSLLLSVEAFNKYDTYNTRSSLLTALNTFPHITRPVFVDSGNYSKMIMSERLLATGNNEGEIFVWDAEDKSLVYHLSFGEGSLSEMKFSEDGSRLSARICSDQKCHITFWDLTTGNKINDLVIPPADLNVSSQVYPLAWSSDGENIAIPSCARHTDELTECIQSQISLVDIHTGKTRAAPIPLDLQSISYLAFVPRKNEIFSIGCQDTQTCAPMQAVFIDVRTGNQIKKFLPSEVTRNYFGYPIVSPKGIIIFNKDHTGGSEASEWVAWDVLAEEEKASKSFPASQYQEVAVPLPYITINRDGNVVGIGYFETVKIWKLDEGRTYDISLAAYPDMAPEFVLSPSGKLFTAKLTGLARSDIEATGLIVGNIDETVLQHPLPHDFESMISTAYNPGGKYFVTSDCVSESIAKECKRGMLTFWDAVTLQPVKEYKTPGTFTSYLRYSPDGKLLVSLDNLGYITTWNAETFSQILTSEKPLVDEVWDVAISPDDRVITFALSGNAGVGPVEFIDAQTLAPLDVENQLVENIGNTYPILDVAFNNRGDLVTWADSGSKIHIWNFAEKKLVADEVYGAIVAFSPDDQLMVSGGEDGTLQFWDAVTLKPSGPVFRASDYAYGITELEFSGDGNYLFVQSTDGGMWAHEDSAGKFSIVDVKNRQRIDPPIPIPKTGMSINSAGTKLLSPGYLWDVNPQAWLKLACRIAGRNFTQAEWEEYFPGEAYRATCQDWPLEEPETILPTLTPTPVPSPTIQVVETMQVGELININTASVQELDKLPGIGPTTAQKIIDYRTQNGPFRTIEEIMYVSGIGATLFDEIKSFITIE
jgi:competence ComEA-like helix-hairpin-helix protein